MNIITATASPDPERRPSALDDLASGLMAGLITYPADGPLFAAIRGITGESR